MSADDAIESDACAGAIRWRSSPDAAIKAVLGAGPDTPVVVDFDQTLFLHNSTEEYLDRARPRLLAYVLLSIIGLIRPWMLWKGEMRSHARDWFRVMVVSVLMPWTPWTWRRSAHALAAQGTNQALAEAMDASPSRKIVVATYGFGFIVAPLLRVMPVTISGITAPRLWLGLRDRSEGKKPGVDRLLVPDSLSDAIVVTDSIRDRDLLDAAQGGHLTDWPTARFRRAFERMYLPFVYLDRIKHPGQRFFLKTVVGDDWAVLVLAVAWGSPSPVRMGLALMVLMLSFWVIYEVGYHENDRVAERSEGTPTLRQEYHEYLPRPRPGQPWMWAVAVAAVGSWLLAPAARTEMSGFAVFIAWMVLLMVTRGLFWLYNHVDKRSRVWLYSLLHVARTYGVLLVVAVDALGAIALAAQLLSRWISYVVYRLGDGVWPGPGITQLMRLVVFTLLALPTTAAFGSVDLVWNWQAFAILAWFGIRARRGILEAVRSVSRVG